MTPETHELTNIQLDLHHDLSDADTKRAIHGMLVMNRAIDRVQKQLTSGRLNRGDVETLNDCLAEHGLDPFDYHEEVVNNINAQIRRRAWR